MARPERIEMEVKASVDAGRAEHVFRFRDKYVQVHGAFVATLQVEGSIDGNDYFVIGAPTSVPGVVPVAETVQFLRIRTTAYTSGTPEATFAGFDERAI